jgi:hypothetical protein
VIGQDDKTVAAILAVHVSGGMAVVQPIVAVTQTAELIGASQLQLRGPDPPSLAVAAEGMGRAVLLVEITHQADAISPGTVGYGEGYTSNGSSSAFDALDADKGDGVPQLPYGPVLALNAATLSATDATLL